MVSKLRFSANINTFNACADRYVLEGYGERRNTDKLIEAAQQVEDLTGVEVSLQEMKKFGGMPSVK